MAIQTRRSHEPEFAARFYLAARNQEEDFTRKITKENKIKQFWGVQHM
jgi:hypothetical protein